MVPPRFPSSSAAGDTASGPAVASTGEGASGAVEPELQED